MLRIKRPFIISFFGCFLSCLLMMTGLSEGLWLIFAVLTVLFTVFTLRKAALGKVLLVFLSFAVISLGTFTLYDTLREKENGLTGYGKEISGTVTSITTDKNGFISGAVISDCTVENTKIYSDIKVYTDNKADFSYGDTLSFTADELFTSEGEGIFRYHSLSDRCHLACTYKTKNSTVTKSDKNLYIRILEFRGFASGKLRTALSKNSLGLTEALLTGSRDNISPEMSLNFRICGISHIFAVSGMHLSLWTGIFFIILKKRTKLSALPNILAMAFVLFYMVFTGFSPSVLRAGIMLITVFLGRLIKRQADTLNSLGLAGTVLLCLNPYLAGNISFLLSFIATGAIAFWNEYILPEKKELHGAFRKIRYRMLRPYYNTVISVAVILTTLPAVSLFFGYISLLSPVASLIITPMAEAVMILSSLLVLLPSGNGIYSALVFINEAACSRLTETFTKLSEADFMLLPSDFTLLLPIFLTVTVLCAVFLLIFRERKKALISILSGFLAFLVLTGISLYRTADETEIVIFGTENATLISVSDNFSDSAVIGSGGSFSLVSELSQHLGRKAIVKTDLLFIPRNKDTENKNTAYLEKSLLPLKTVCAEDAGAPVRISLWDGCSIYAETTDDFSALSLYIDETKIVICTLPSSEFTDRHIEFMQGDILICRSDIPQSLDTDAFNDVIIITDDLKERLSSFFSTENGNITIKIKGDSYAVY